MTNTTTASVLKTGIQHAEMSATALTKVDLRTLKGVNRTNAREARDSVLSAVKSAKAVLKEIEKESA